MGSNLKSARFIASVFAGADLSRADLSDSEIIGANFSGANLSHARMRSTEARGVVFANAIMTRVDLSDADTDVLPGEEYQDVTWDSPVRVFQTHFTA